MNTLYPIFLKTETLQILVVGGGYVAEEKLHFLFKSSPAAQVSLVATFFRKDTMQLINKYGCEYMERRFEKRDLIGKHIVIAATDDELLNREIYKEARARSLLVNVADSPELCDFYLGGIVTKGDVKIAISTNGRSPILAKRLRQFFESVLPDEMRELTVNLHTYRKRLKGNFEEKLKKLNELTRSVIE